LFFPFQKFEKNFFRIKGKKEKVIMSSFHFLLRHLGREEGGRGKVGGGEEGE
jgi:hypothetical protein